jgi:hypothetical protein
MVHSGLTAIEAGKKLKIPARSARRIISRPNALALLHQEKQALRSSIQPKIIHRLLSLALQDRNMNAAVAACKVIEGSPDDMPQHAGAAAAKPGLVIVVTGGGAPHQHTIEHTAEHAPAIDVTPGRSAVATLDDPRSGRRQVGPGPRLKPPQ